ncbi:MAG: DUF2292 domain-containing protein [Planctomycetia bacterium]|nr:DUF2292 domain-containing protein [Planctomycetia bacterium]
MITSATVSLICWATSARAGDSITKRMQEFAEARQFFGSVTLVAHEGKVVHLEAVGVADVATG